MTYCDILEHNQIKWPTRTYCASCQKNQLSWQPKHLQPRAFGDNITNISGPEIRGYRGQFRGSKTNWGYKQCNIPLCKIGDCWRL